jgi:hypothetical protein
MGVSLLLLIYSGTAPKGWALLCFCSLALLRVMAKWPDSHNPTLGKRYMIRDTRSNVDHRGMSSVAIALLEFGEEVNQGDANSERFKGCQSSNLLSTYAYTCARNTAATHTVYISGAVELLAAPWDNCAGAFRSVLGLRFVSLGRSRLSDR